MKSEAGVVATPDKTFWEDDLEMGFDHILTAARQEGYVDGWIDKRNGREVGIILTALGIDDAGSTRRKKEVLRSCTEQELLPFILVTHFAMYKSKVAVIDFASRALDDEVLERCRKGEEDFDKTALLLAIYSHNWKDLRLVFHLDKIHKTGFARMVQRRAVRRPEMAFGEFLQPDTVAKILERFDGTRGDGLTSQLKEVLSHDDRHLVFIRRAYRPDHLLRPTGNVLHGYKPEWIILDFEGNPKHVDISSVSVSIPLEMANHIAGTFYGKACEYENENVITYPKQIERFLEEIRGVEEGELVLVEVATANSPLDGAPKLKLSNPDTGSVGKAVRHLESAVGEFLLDIEQLESVKVLYRGKRVSLIFEKEEGAEECYVVRYSDHRLNGLERRLFEQHIRDIHGITILSTEKRYKRPA